MGINDVTFAIVWILLEMKAFICNSIVKYFLSSEHSTHQFGDLATQTASIIICIQYFYQTLFETTTTKNDSVIQYNIFVFAVNVFIYVCVCLFFVLCN